MRRKILMGVLVFGVVAGFGSEIRRMRGCHGGCPDERSSGFAAAELQKAPQANEHHKGGHCDGWKKNWSWSSSEQKAPETPETPVTTAQN